MKHKVSFDLTEPGLTIATFRDETVYAEAEHLLHKKIKTQLSDRRVMVAYREER